jgi:hypothetical protein
VGTYLNSVWSYYTNRRKERPYPSRPTMQQFRNMAERLSVPIDPDFLPVSPSLDVEVGVISVDSGYTVARAVFRIVSNSTNTDFVIERVT